ncbi:MAG: transglutaminase-like domain-containing protein [Kiritimatiellia bacterium]
MVRCAYRLVAISFWLGMLYWLVRYEAFPEHFTRTSAGYRSLLPQQALMQDSWMRILFGEQPLGYARTQMDVNETDSREHYVVRSVVHLRVNLMGEHQEVQLFSDVSLDEEYALQRFTFGLSSPGQQLQVTATRERGSKFGVRIRAGDTVRETSLDIPDDVVVYSPMTEMAMRNLKPGEQLTIRVLDPATLSTANLLVKALRQETLEVGGKKWDAMLLSVTYMNVEFNSWMAPDGTILRQTTPFGWTLEACSPEEAYRAIAAASSGADMLTRMAIPCTGRIRNPHSASALVLRLKNITLSREELEGNRQSVRRQDGTEIELVVRAAQIPTQVGDGQPTGDLAPYLASSAWIQSDDPEIVRQAQEITRGRITGLDKAIAIHDWVHRNMRKEMTVSVPSAVEILKTLQGDCNEHTYLFVALARAAGIPARVTVGVVYRDGKFYYHAWPAVFVGEWLEMDPTWGQRGVDATHIALLTGELANQLRLVNVMGRLQIELLEEQQPAKTE